MNLDALGYDSWFRQHRTEKERSTPDVARITRVDRGRYLVHTGQKEIPAELAGKFLYALESRVEIPCVGDWVAVVYHHDQTLALIQDCLPRKTFLSRKTPGKMIDTQVLAANIDTALIIQSCDRDFNLRRLERYLVMIAEGNIEPVILLSKSDLVSTARLEEMIAMIRQNHVHARTIGFSNTTGQGLDGVGQLLEKNKTYCLLGSSGVGKTTLLNKLIGEEKYDTRSVRRQDSRGRHTTAYRQLIRLENGALVIDTPGLRELGMIGTDGGLDDHFSDMAELAAGCRFKDCSHIHERGCAIVDALNRGELDQGRYQNYLKLKKESAYHERSYVEKRRKDREFGRMVKTILKNKKKK